MNEKKPIDVGGIIGGALQFANTLGGLIQPLIPTAEERRLNKAFRQLKHRYKGMEVDYYVDLFFKDYSEEQKADARALLKARLFRNNFQ